ncbi:MAG: molybdopterin converting factor subunit 1 [Candidatus Cyclobacteriaceae bacterium M3_2C_046]
MKIDIHLFGITKEIVGKPKLVLEMTQGQSVSDLKNKLQADYPGLSDLRSVMVAINNEYAKNDQLIEQNDEIALIPPVSGG